jgi:Ca2+-binding RTX toxin-like protein
MINTAGAIITVELPPSDGNAPLQSASVQDLVARPDGGFMIGDRVSIDSLISNSSTNLYLRTYGADDAPDSTREAIESVLLYAQPYTLRFAETGGDSAVAFVQGQNGLTIREYLGSNASLVDGPEPGIDGDTDSQTFIADAVTLAGGGSFLLYQDDDAGDGVVRGRTFDEDNQPVAGHFDVAKIVGKDIGFSRASGLANGNIAVTFTIADDSESGDIYVKVISDDGDTEKDTVQINTKSAGRQFGSQIAALDSGGFAVAWIDTDQNGSDGVKARTFDANGKATSVEFNVDTPSNDDQNGITVTALSGGRFAVLWEEELGGGKIWAKLYDREGGEIGEQTLITEGASPAYYDQSARAIEVDNGVMVVAWTRDVKQEGILARRFDVGQAGTDGDDRLNSKMLGRFLDGLDGNDKLTGGKTADELNGGAGKDTLSGKQGNDIFVFLDLADSGVGKSNRDLITDFGTGKDRIDLSAIDAIDGGGDDKFGFLKKADFNGDEGVLRYETSRQSTLVQIDIDGDRTADFELELSDKHVLTAKDFIL